MKVKKIRVTALCLQVLFLVAYAHHANGEDLVSLSAGPDSARICLECHKAEQQKLMGEWEHVAMKSATIQLKIDDRHEIVTFDKGRLKVANSPVKGDTEKKLRAIKEGAEVSVTFKERDGVREALSISIKPPVKVAAKERMKLAELERLVALGTEKGGYLLIDSRPAESFARGAVPTAENIPFQEFAKGAALLPKDRKRLIVFYGDNAWSRMGTDSMKRAKALGYSNVRVMVEGLEGWLAGKSGAVSAAALAEGYKDVPYVLLDVRSVDAAGKGFIMGATSFAGADAKALKTLPKKELKAPIIVYDEEGKGSAPKVATEIVKSGQVNVMVLAGGIAAAREAGVAIASGAPPSAVTYAPRPKPGSFPMDDFIAIIGALPADTLLLDVRNGEELKAGSIRGAMNIPVQEIFRRASEVPMDKRVIAYCNSGARAEMAYHILREKGLTNVYFLKAHVDYDGGEPDIY